MLPFYILQNKTVSVCNIQCVYYFRRAESRSLLCKLAYEKAKLELLHLKQEIMRVITLFLVLKSLLILLA